MSPEEALAREALAARDRAYAPYSGFAVGAAVRLRDGRTFVGVNVENCAYPLTVCAERNAVAAAVAGGARPRDVVAVAVAAATPGVLSPCGACRQVLAEFAEPDVPVALVNLSTGGTRQITVGALLPLPFSETSLARLS